MRRTSRYRATTGGRARTYELRCGDDDDEIDESVFDEDVEISDADFDGDTFKSRTLKSWAETPPMTQAYVGASLALTCGSFLAFNNQWPEWLHLNWGAVFKRAQVWGTRGVFRLVFLLLPGCEDFCMPPQSEIVTDYIAERSVLSFNI